VTGDMAQAVLDGDYCQECMEFLGDGDGYPRSCDACRAAALKRPKVLEAMAPTTLYCPLCRTSTKGSGGLRNHVRDRHRMTIDKVIEKIRSS